MEKHWSCTGRLSIDHFLKENRKRTSMSLDYFIDESAPIPWAYREDALYRRLAEIGFGTFSFDLYPGQVECAEAIFAGENILCCFPTGYGKTLCAQFLFAETKYTKNQGSILLVPLKALADNHAETLRETGFNVQVLTSDYDASALDERADIFIFSYEKFDSLMSKEYTRAFIRQHIGAIVIDEIHAVGGEDRGPNLEASLIAAMAIFPDMQYLGLSATIANPAMVAEWLHAKLIHIDEAERPIPLTRHFIALAGDARIPHLRKLVWDRAQRGERGLIFVSARSRSYEISAMLNKVVVKYFVNAWRHCAEPYFAEALNESKLHTLLHTLEATVQQTLGESFRQRVLEWVAKNSQTTHRAFKAQAIELQTKLQAFLKQEVTKLENKDRFVSALFASPHCAGLNRTDREIVENNFTYNEIKSIVCTPTLAQGVNIAADYVVLFDVHRYNPLTGESDLIPANELIQMAGRAGRVGKSQTSNADVYVYHPSEDGLEVRRRLTNPIDVQSYIPNVLHEKILRWVKTGFQTKADLKELCTHLLPPASISEGEFEDAVNYLVDNEFVTETEGGYQCTRLGTITATFYLLTDTALHFKQLALLPLSDAIDARWSIPRLFSVVMDVSEFLDPFDWRNEDMELFTPKSVELGREIRQWLNYDEMLKAYILLFHADFENEYTNRSVRNRAMSVFEAGKQVMEIFLTSTREYNNPRVALKLLKSAMYNASADREFATLMCLPKIGKTTARGLIAEGITTVLTFLKTDIETLVTAANKFRKRSQISAHDLQQLQKKLATAGELRKYPM